MLGLELIIIFGVWYICDTIKKVHNYQEKKDELYVGEEQGMQVD